MIGGCSLKERQTQERGLKGLLAHQKSCGALECPMPTGSGPRAEQNALPRTRKIGHEPIFPKSHGVLPLRLKTLSHRPKPRVTVGLRDKQ
jgi:hypothetical protein